MSKQSAQLSPQQHVRHPIFELPIFYIQHLKDGRRELMGKYDEVETSRRTPAAVEWAPCYLETVPS